MKMRKALCMACVVAGLSFCLLGGAALADVSWYTNPSGRTMTPILGYDSLYDGNVNILTDTGWVVIPYDDPGTGIVTTGASMSVFTVGQQVHTGSGVTVDDGVAYTVDMVFTGPSRVVSYSEGFTGSGGFWMTWNTAAGGGDGGGLPTLTAADIGSWEYVETYTDPSTQRVLLTLATPFQVEGVVPEPGTLIIWSLLGALGITVGWWRCRRHAA